MTDDERNSFLDRSLENPAHQDANLRRLMESQARHETVLQRLIESLIRGSRHNGGSELQ